MSFPNFNASLQRVIGYLWDPEPKNTDLMNSIWLLGREYPSAPARPRPPPPSAPPDSSSSSSNSSAPPPTTAPPPTSLLTSPTSPKTSPASPTPASPPPPPPTATSATTTTGDEPNEAQLTWPRAFLEDFESRIWMTYRCEFAPIPRSMPGSAGLSLMTQVRSHLPVHAQGFTSDQGWGCMVRSGQCVLANALATLRFGRDWRYGQRLEDEKQILSLFADDPAAPFSIHKFVQQGELRDIRSGQWFGPTPAAQAMKALIEAYPQCGLRVWLTFDGNVYDDSFLQTAVAGDGAGTFMPTLLLVVTRLGLDSLNAVYWNALKAAVQMPMSLGIAGGRPSSSHYFVGVQADNLFYLDPHVVRLALSSRPSDAEVASCHSRRLRRLHVRDVDPSMMFAFLIRSHDEYAAWRSGVRGVQGRGVVTVAPRDPNSNTASRDRGNSNDHNSDGNGGSGGGGSGGGGSGRDSGERPEAVDEVISDISDDEQLC